MAKVATHLSFPGNAEEAFALYQSVFGVGFSGPVMRFRDAPPTPGMPPLSVQDAGRIMHAAMALPGGHVLMGGDALPAMCPDLRAGNQMSLHVDVDTVVEAERIFAALAQGGQISMPMADMFWGVRFGALKDRFGIGWMLSCPIVRAM